MKKRIGDMEYNIIPTPPWVAPTFRRAAELLKHMPKTVEEAKRTREEAKAWMLEVLKETVQPKPEPDHYLQCWNIVVELTNKAVEEAGFFRNTKGSGAGKGNAAGAGPSQATK